MNLGRILDDAHAKKALQSLWRYNFTPDVGLDCAEQKVIQTLVVDLS